MKTKKVDKVFLLSLAYYDAFDHQARAGNFSPFGVLWPIIVENTLRGRKVAFHSIDDPGGSGAQELVIAYAIGGFRRTGLLFRKRMGYDEAVEVAHALSRELWPKRNPVHVVAESMRKGSMP